ncbi:MAG: butyrate kinase [Treponema sp.]|nr:butyrate kinase [Treponema sp.]
MIEKNTELVELTVLNEPGVLGRVAGHIRREGWNIKRLTVDETGFRNETPQTPAGTGTSYMEIEIEGTHTKLAQVMEHILNLNCVVSIGMMHDGKKIVRSRPREQQKNILPQTKAVNIPPKKPGVFRILAINPGSTSTKFAIYDDDTCILEKKIRHDAAETSHYNSVLEQKEMRRICIMKDLEKAGIDYKSLDAIAGRGGLLKPIESGVYIINEKMLEDLNTASAAVHASALGAIIASELAASLSIPAYVVDPIVVDEMDRNAKLTGIPGIERSSIFHALNHKAIARRLAEQLGKPYENARFVVAHLGGGISVGAHRYGRVIDVNDALSGEGPFTPERSGNVPAVPLINMCFSGEYTREEMFEKIVGKGGMKAYLGTSDEDEAQKMINNGDEFAALVLDSMAYQVSKEIGAMCAVLEGLVDAIILTGGLAHSSRFTGSIKLRVDKLAPVYVFPGEDEMLALASGVLRVLRGREKPAYYN